MINVDETELEQSAALLCGHVPPLLFSYFEALKESGFTEEQAFTLTINYQNTTLKPNTQS